MTRTLALLALAGCFPRLSVDTTGDGANVGVDSGDGGDAGDDGGDAGDDGGDAGDDGGDAGDDGDDGGDAVAPTLSGVDPADGSEDGGLRVRISGTGLDTDPRVWFGGNEAQIRTIGPTALDVDVPPSPGTSGRVDVRVATGGGDATLSQAFHYWPDATGRAVVHLRSRVIEGEDQDGVWRAFYAASYPTEPVDAWSTDVNAGMDSCSASFPSAAYYEGPSSLSISGGPGTYALPWLADAELNYHEDEVTTEESLRGAAFDVESPAGGTWPAFSATQALRFPTYMRLFSPTVGGFDSVTLSTFTITWTASGADRVAIRFVDYMSGNAVTCTTPNDGVFDVPNSIIDDFTPYSEGWWSDTYVVYVGVVAYRDTTTVLPFDNGELRAQGGIGFGAWVQVED